MKRTLSVKTENKIEVNIERKFKTQENEQILKID